MSEALNPKRYEPAHIELENKNSSHSLIVWMTGRDKRVLEIGTSTGYVSRLLRENGNSLTGIEIDAEAGDIARQYCDRVIIGDVESLDLAEFLGDARFDVIVLGDVLEHLRGPGQLLDKVKPYLGTDGYLVVSIPNACHGDVIIRLMGGDFMYTPIGLLDSTHLRFFGLKNIFRLFNDHGYNIEDVNRVIVPVGHTEQKVEALDRSGVLFQFIDSLPDSSVYQFVFRAIPGGEAAPEIAAPRALEGYMDEAIGKHSEILEQAEKRNEALYEKLRDTTSRAQNLERELNDIRKSIVWRLVTGYHRNVVDRFLPIGKRRRAAYDLVLKGGRILADRGPAGFLSKAIDYNKKKAVNKGDYAHWIAQNEPSDDTLWSYAKESREFAYRPKISIITPVYNPDVAWIKAAVDSVLAQAYDNWELCLADASTKEDVKKCLAEYARRDARIKLRFLPKNRGIAGNSNEALALATGEFIGLMDHDDTLSPDALYEAVKYLQDREADMIYSDEDKIDVNGNRYEPFFKPAWSPDMFLSCMYTCHFGVYRKSILDEIGGFREGYEGSQDYDLVLRLIERTGRIGHIPRVLYHWRMVPGSSAVSTDAKKYAYTSAKKALADYMRRNHIEGKVLDGVWTGSYRVQRDLVRDPPVSIIIPVKDKPEVLRKCVESIHGRTTYGNYEIIVVNNNSELEETYAYFKELAAMENVRVIDFNGKFNFSAINNFAARQANGEILLLLNNDTEVISGEWLSAMLEHAQRKEVGAVGCKLLYPDDSVQHAGVVLGLRLGGGEKGVAGHAHKHQPNAENGYFGKPHIIHDVSCVTAACMMMRREVFEELGGFDEGLAIAFNDVELCIRIRESGYLIVYTPFAALYHHESLSRGYENTPEKQARFAGEVEYIRKKWGDTIDAGDPYYSPNMTLDKEDCSIRT